MHAHKHHGQNTHEAQSSRIILSLVSASVSTVDNHQEVYGPKLTYQIVRPRPGWQLERHLNAVGEIAQ